MFAVIETGGKQYKVKVGDVLNVEKLSVENGEVVEIDKVLMVENDGLFQVGTPVIEGAKVVAKVVEHGRSKKVIAFRYKPKKNVRVKKGHRQAYTRILVESINA
ncbi:MAG: 50S ribosomal protein L21 [Eubacteriales bacterium]